MPVFTPDGTVRLLSVPFDSELRNTLWFPDRTTQTNYWLGQETQITYYDVNYVKKDNALVVPTPIDQTWKFNYCMYQNSNFTDKWFYAFIVAREWASNNSTRLYLRTDPLQTWMFDWVLKTSFVTRQHSTTDVAGDNIIEEPCGSTNGCTIYQAAGAQDCSLGRVFIYATANPDGTPAYPTALQHGVYSACAVTDSESVNNLDSVGLMLEAYVNSGLASAVARVQAFPSFGDTATGMFETTKTWNKHPANIDGYTPKNNKLLSGAFVKGFIAGFGQQATFVPEFCQGSTVNTKFSVDPTTGSLYVSIDDYGKPSNESSGLGGNSVIGILINYPESTWAYNQYKNDYNLHSGSNTMYAKRIWQDRNAGALISGMDVIGGGLSIAGGIVDTLNPMKAAFSGVSSGLQAATSGAQQMAQGINKTMQYIGGYDEVSQELERIAESYNAPATGSVATSNPFLANGNTNVKYGWLVLPRQIAERVDSFLTVYGYAQNQYMVPNLHARQSWTYVKVAELMADCNCPDDDEVMIKAAFNKGIFFWSYTASYGDFSQNNGIV